MRVRAYVGVLAVSVMVGAVVAPTAGAETSGGATVPTSTTTASTDPAPVSTVTQTQTVTLTKAQTKAVQRKLGVTADGVFGAKSRSALSRWQARKKLTRTGTPDLETLQAMHLSFADTVAKTVSSVQSTGTDSGMNTATANETPAVAEALAAVREEIGTPYESGGESPGGFDCSGLMVWAFAQAHVKLPRTSFDQFKAGTAVAKADIRPGDLVFFATDGPGASHVGVATSATTAISATSHGVMQHKIFDDYWGAAYVGARRVA